MTLSRWKFGPAAMATQLSQIGHFSYSALESVHTYVRRQSLSDQINHRLQSADTGHRKLVLLSGLAGSGKTQLALDYLQQFGSSYDATMWIEARTRDTLQRDFVNLYETLYQGRVTPVGNPAAFDSILIAIKAWFSRQQGPCLMVFDGANLADDETASDSIDLKHFLPNAPNLHIIITTRTSTALDMSPLRGVAVGAMELSQAVELFHKSSRIPQDDATVKDEVITIVKELGCIALAVSIAGTQIGRSPWLQSKVTAYLPASDDFSNLLHQKPEPLVHQYDTSVHSVWQTALEASNKICPGAATLMSVLSFLYHDDIFPSVFNASGQRGDGGLNCSDELGWRSMHSAEPLSDIQMLERCFQALEGCCLVCWDGSQKTYHVNRLVHNWARSRIPPSERCEISAAALTLLVEATKTCSHAPRDKLRLLPHLMATFRGLSTTEADSSALEKLEAFGRFARECGRPKEAKVVLEYVLQNRKRILGNDHPEVFVTMGYLATALADLGQFNEALGLIEKVLQFRAETDGEDHLDTIEATNILVIILRGLGRHAKAMHFSQDVLRKRSRLLGGEHPDTIGAVGNLATLYAELGHVDVAITMKEEVLTKRKAEFGAEHPKTLGAAHSLGVIRGKAGQLQQSVAILEDAVEKMKRVMGEDHPDTINATSNLAVSLCKLKCHDKALAFERHVVEKWTDVLGEHHPHTIGAQSTLAVTLADLGELNEAANIATIVVEKTTSIFGDTHPETVSARQTRAAILKRLDLSGISALPGTIVEARIRPRKRNADATRGSSFAPTHRKISILTKVRRVLWWKA